MCYGSKRWCSKAARALIGDNGRLDKESAFGGHSNFPTTAVIFTWGFSFIPTLVTLKHLTFFFFSFRICASGNPWKQYHVFLRTRALRPTPHPPTTTQWIHFKVSDRLCLSVLNAFSCCSSFHIVKRNVLNEELSIKWAFQLHVYLEKYFDGACASSSYGVFMHCFQLVHLQIRLCWSSLDADWLYWLTSQGAGSEAF